MTDKILRPIIFEYLDISMYLQDFYRFRKSKEKDFSYEKWGQELNISSRSFLRLMVLGRKKITPAFAICFAQTSLNSDGENHFFQLLIQFSLETDLEVRKTINAEIIKVLRHHNGYQEIRDQKNFLSDPGLPRLFALMSFEDIPKNAVFFANAMKADLPVVEGWLATLKDLGLITESQNGRTEWQAVTDHFRVPDDRGSLDLMHFHEVSLREAIKAYHYPKESRRYKSLLLPLSVEDLSEFNQQLDEFARNQMLKYNSKTFAGKRMFQINFNFYNVTEEVAQK